MQILRYRNYLDYKCTYITYMLLNWWWFFMWLCFSYLHAFSLSAVHWALRATVPSPTPALLHSLYIEQIVIFSALLCTYKVKGDSTVAMSMIFCVCNWTKFLSVWHSHTQTHFSRSEVRCGGVQWWLKARSWVNQWWWVRWWVMNWRVNRSDVSNGPT